MQVVFLRSESLKKNIDSLLRKVNNSCIGFVLFVADLGFTKNVTDMLPPAVAQ